jgi:hypothetical protein
MFKPSMAAAQVSLSSSIKDVAASTSGLEEMKPLLDLPLFQRPSHLLLTDWP